MTKEFSETNTQSKPHYLIGQLSVKSSCCFPTFNFHEARSMVTDALMLSSV